jgi:hypothetical protein
LICRMARQQYWFKNQSLLYIPQRKCILISHTYTYQILRVSKSNWLHTFLMESQLADHFHFLNVVNKYVWITLVILFSLCCS